MELKDLAEFLAVLTILEPDAKICKITARLASAGTATAGDTDTTVLKEVKTCLPELEAELKGIDPKKLALKENILVRILTPDQKIGNMELKDLAEFLAILTILEPDAKLCQLVARLASAGTATAGDTDTTVLKEVKTCLSELEAELKGIDPKKLALKENILVKILTPDLKLRNIELKDLAEVFAILTILEPDAKICQLTARLAIAGTATAGETDTTVLKEIKSCLPELEAELKGVSEKKLDLKEKVLVKILTPDPEKTAGKK
ncbi:hypothetical protein [Floridanema evergladense]|uniref:Flagellar motor switch protein FliG C-terminal domain-containing protein n=1 Tax=Floridaenema evergladense BLCC-F167 TaxID=3153639 RepID=A0ABV4WWS0_9CYAN